VKNIDQIVETYRRAAGPLEASTNQFRLALELRHALDGRRRRLGGLLSELGGWRRRLGGLRGGLPGGWRWRLGGLRGGLLIGWRRSLIGLLGGLRGGRKLALRRGGLGGFPGNLPSFGDRRLPGGWNWGRAAGGLPAALPVSACLALVNGSKRGHRAGDGAWGHAFIRHDRVAKRI
jgi:hypothetical protein